MEEITLTGQSISAFREFLVENEKARATVEKYVQEAEQLRLALCGAPVTKAGVLAYRERLQQQYRALTVNNKLSAVNAYLRFCGAEHCEVKLLKVQRRAFREEQRDLTESEYRRLLSIAKGRKNQRLYHVMLTICATGIRVSELRFITTEAPRAGRTEIRRRESAGPSCCRRNWRNACGGMPGRRISRRGPCSAPAPGGPWTAATSGMK